MTGDTLHPASAFRCFFHSQNHRQHSTAEAAPPEDGKTGSSTGRMGARQGPKKETPEIHLWTWRPRQPSGLSCTNAEGESSGGLRTETFDPMEQIKEALWLHTSPPTPAPFALGFALSGSQEEWAMPGALRTHKRCTQTLPRSLSV